jgi:cytochrome c oxidase subunit 3
MANVTVDPKALIPGERPAFNTSYGKLMMWFFLMSDAFTFSGLLIAYGASRMRVVSQGFSWANPEEVFTHAPILYEVFHLEAPLSFVGLMTFILILSSVTMVLAVEAGHRNSKKEVVKWLAWTVVGGAAFLLCQAYEWYHFIHGTDLGALLMPDGTVAHYLDEAKEAIKLANGTILEGTAAQAALESATAFRGAGTVLNEYGPPAFADFFFFVTGFHGTHVLSGVVINLIILLNVMKGTYEKRGHYEMVEKIGLYWHFVDLVWVFVFTFFYLV